MAVIKAKPEKFMPMVLQIAERELVLPLMTIRVADDTFNGALNDTVTMRVGRLRTVARKYEFRSRNAPIQLDDISGEGQIPVTLDTHTYSATGLTDEQMTLDDIEWVADVMQPQATAVAEDLENDVATAFQDIKWRHELNYNGSTDDPFELAVLAGEYLDTGGPSIPGVYVPISGLVPSGNRFWLMGSTVASSVVTSDRFESSRSGDAVAESAFREANIGRIAGFQVMKSLVVPPTFSVFMHKTALVLGTVSPRAPRGAAMSQRISKNGMAMRWLIDYDASYLRDRSVVSMFSGITEVYDERIGGSGTDRYNLKDPDDYTMVGDDVPKSFRGIGVNFTP